MFIMGVLFVLITFCAFWLGFLACVHVINKNLENKTGLHYYEFSQFVDNITQIDKIVFVATVKKYLIK